MKFKEWLRLEKEDLDGRFRDYPRHKALVFFSIVFGFFFSLFWLWQKTFSLRIKNFDGAIIDLILKIKSSFLESFFSLITFLGTGYFIAVISFVLFIFLIKKRRKRAAFISLIALAGSAALVTFFKIFFSRQRPGDCPGDFGDFACLSFPSGHAAISFYFYGLLNYLIFRFAPISLKSFLLISFLLIFLIILISFSRVFLLLHYPSDIIGGFFLGGVWLFLAVFLIDILY